MRRTPDIYVEELELLWGRDFFEECKQVAIKIAEEKRPDYANDRNVTPSLILAVAIGKILNDFND